MNNPMDEFPPESCPFCGKDNWHSDTETYVHKSEVWCSDECERLDTERQREADDAYAAALLEDEQLWKQLR